MVICWFIVSYRVKFWPDRQSIRLIGFCVRMDCDWSIYFGRDTLKTLSEPMHRHIDLLLLFLLIWYHNNMTALPRQSVNARLTLPAYDALCRMAAREDRSLTSWIEWHIRQEAQRQGAWIPAPIRSLPPSYGSGP